MQSERSLEVLAKYSDFEKRQLDVQLRMLSNIAAFKNCRTLKSVCCEFSKLPPETRAVFGEVERLLRVLAVVPTSIASAESSFSMLHRLKTWLRSTMFQQRLNHCAILHTHQEVLDTLNLLQLAREFVGTSEFRRGVFLQLVIRVVLNL